MRSVSPLYLPDGVSAEHPIAVLAPHPDDESLGCGALLARAFAGEGAHVICLTDGSASHPGSRLWPAPRLAAIRRAELEAAVICLGGRIADISWMGLPDSQLWRMDPTRIALDLLPIIDGIGARQIFAPAPEDHHADHKATARIACEIARLRPDWSFFSYPVWSRWDDPHFDRNIVRHRPMAFDPGQWRARKRAAILAHQSQLGAIVQDDPDGFVMPPEFVEKFASGDEIYWRVS